MEPCITKINFIKYPPTVKKPVKNIKGQLNANTHQIAGTASIYALNNCRHSARAAVRFSLKLVRE
jgi:hypothetical protein